MSRLESELSIVEHFDVDVQVFSFFHRIEDECMSCWQIVDRHVIHVTLTWPSVFTMIQSLDAIEQ